MEIRILVSLIVLMVFGAALECVAADSGTTVWLDTLDVKNIKQGWGEPKAGKSCDGNPITMAEKVYAHGIGLHSAAVMCVDLKGKGQKFSSYVGVDDETRGLGSVIFQVWLDGKEVYDSGLLRGGDDPKLIEIDLTGAKQMLLIVDEATDGMSSDHADLADAQILVKAGETDLPRIIPVPVAKAEIASGVSPKPSINGTRIVGTTPGRPFLFLIPATGEGPLTFSAKNLPAGLTLDPKTGIITGSLQKAGTYVVDLAVKGAKGKASRQLTIVGGDHKLALTPPMGWNSWNCWAGAIDDAKVRAAADAMVASGLAAHGYEYVNIDDTWEKGRDANGEVLGNEKFPDMKALADYVHGKGLKLGIYSSPGPRTCANFEGSYQHEEQDAKTYAKWGIDYLKYDWCSYSEIARSRDLSELKKPYSVMRDALDKCGRDIVYSLCQYGMGKVWEWGAEVGGNCWRTGGDINDSWGSVVGCGFSQDGHQKFAGPGHWNDPDMLVVGMVGWGPNLHPSGLTQNEQVTHITLWSLLSSPLLIGCDMTRLDQFTSDLLMNDEVIAINQDPLGKPAGRVAQAEGTQVWSRPLSDGTIAVGLFNTSVQDTDVTVKWTDVGAKGKQPVRNLWLKKDLGSFSDAFTAKVPSHGAVFIKIGKPK